MLFASRALYRGDTVVDVAVDGDIGRFISLV